MIMSETRPNDSLLRVEGLSKHYRTRGGLVKALDQCTLAVPVGEVFGLLGPNGAGKTTLIRTLLGYLKPTHGSATIHGLDCRTQSVAVRRFVGYLPAEAKLFRSMRGRDVLTFFAHMHPLGSVTRSLKLAERLQLDLSRRVAFMSTGMRQKLALATVLGCDSPLLILDEPTANLDPSVRQEILLLIREAHEQGRTVLFCSHVLQEIEEVCGWAAIMRQGSVVHTVEIAKLKATHRISATSSGPLAIPESCRLFAQQGDRWSFDFSGSLETLLPWLSQAGLREVRIEPVGLRSLYEEYHQVKRGPVV